MNVKKGDNVKMTAGKDRGKTGKILRVDREKNRVVVEGLNIMKKHIRPRKQGEPGQIASMPRAIDASNVMVICGNCHKPTRTGHRIDGEIKVRYCKKCEAKI